MASRILFCYSRLHTLSMKDKLVEAPDLLLLLDMHSLNVGAHPQLQGAQQALVHLDSFDRPHTASSAETPRQIYVGAQANPVATAHLEKAEDLLLGPLKYEWLLKA